MVKIRTRDSPSEPRRCFRPKVVGKSFVGNGFRKAKQGSAS